MTLCDTTLRTMTAHEAIALGTRVFSAWAEAHATCRKCNARLASETEIRNAARRIPEAQAFELSGFKNPTRGFALETFDSVCLSCGEWASVKTMIDGVVRSGMTITFAPFGRKGFDHARETVNANAYFQIRDMTGTVTNVPFTAIINARPSQRGTKALVTVTVRVP